MSVPEKHEIWTLYKHLPLDYKTIEQTYDQSVSTLEKIRARLIRLFYMSNQAPVRHLLSKRDRVSKRTWHRS